MVEEAQTTETLKNKELILSTSVSLEDHAPDVALGRKRSSSFSFENVSAKRRPSTSSETGNVSISTGIPQNSSHSSRGVTTVVKVPSALMGLVVGRKGSNITRIQEQSNTCMTIMGTDVTVSPICTDLLIEAEDRVTLEKGRALVLEILHSSAEGRNERWNTWRAPAGAQQSDRGKEGVNTAQAQKVQNHEVNTHISTKMSHKKKKKKKKKAGNSGSHQKQLGGPLAATPPGQQRRNVWTWQPGMPQRDTQGAHSAIAVSNQKKYHNQHQAAPYGHDRLSESGIKGQAQTVGPASLSSACKLVVGGSIIPQNQQQN
uniref:K Homology domain-containing protein n=1 Tax=Heterosigma akashiwo TaxID=2829 RepID=A0A6S9I6H4_HETAK